MKAVWNNQLLMLLGIILHPKKQQKKSKIM